MENDFWSKVEKCLHKNHTEHYESVYCATEYCSGSEYRCADCKVFIQECWCGYHNGMSGWSQKRYKAEKVAPIK